MGGGGGGGQGGDSPPTLPTVYIANELHCGIVILYTLYPNLCQLTREGNHILAFKKSRPTKSEHLPMPMMDVVQAWGRHVPAPMLHQLIPTPQNLKQ